MQSSLPLDPSSRPVPQSPSEKSPQVARLAGLGGARFWAIPVALLLVLGLVTVLMLVSPASVRPIISGLGQLFGLLLAASCSLWVSGRVQGRARWAWLCIAIAMLSYVTASILVIYLSSVQNVAPSTSLADAFFLPFYPLMALGVILLPSVQSSGAKQLRVIVDVCIAVGALLGLGLIFLIIPRLASGTSVDYVFIAYPVADFTVLLVLIVLLARGVPNAYRPTFFWLTIGLVCYIYADSAFNYLTLPGLGNGVPYTPGTPYVDPLWVAGSFAFSLAPLYLLTQGTEPGRAWGWLEKLALSAGGLRPSRLFQQFFLLAVPVIILFGLIIFSATFSREGGDKALEVLTLIVVLLIIIRQLLTQRDLTYARIATERAEQLDSLKDQFITSVNHELRTPMMTMQGYIELLGDLEGQLTPARRAEMLERARRANVALVQLLQSILDTRRIDQEAADFVPEVVNLSDAMRAAMQLIDPREGNPAERMIRIQVPENLLVWGEPVRLQQVLMNLVSNAIKYSPPKSWVRVTAWPVVEKESRLIGWGKSRQPKLPMVEITVRDEGLGIPPEQIPLLFRRFVRLPRDLASKVRGTGLGLYLCRLFVEAMGGTIWVESTGIPGEGSTFHLRLPVPQPQPVQPAPAPMMASPGNPQH